jgi:hypothetical protein
MNKWRDVIQQQAFPLFKNLKYQFPENEDEYSEGY